MSRRHGLILISGLLIALVVAMLAGTMVIVAHADLSNTSHYRDRIRAREMALGGLNHLQYRWTYDPGWTQAISQNLEDESYTITFDASDPAHSVNNLMSLVPHTTPSVTGGIVYGGYADVVVVGRAGAALVKLHAITTRGLQSDKAVAASGRIVLQQDCLLDGVTSIVNPQPAGGGLFSDYVSNGIPAIDWTGVPGTFQMLGNSRLAVRPPDSGSAISASLSSFAPKVVETQIPTLKIPELQVDKWVASKAGVPVPPNMSTVSGANFLGSVNIHDDRRVDGDLTVNGDLVLSDGSLYVHGKLRINGGVIGVGSVFVDGDVEITGGATVVQTNQSSGAALFSSGNVTMAGLSADGYLDSLAAAYPTVAAAKATLQSQFYYMNLENSQIDPVNPATYQHFVNSHHYSSTLAGSAIGPGEQHTAYFIQSLPGPNGDYAQGNKNGVLPTMIEHIRNSLGPAYAGDLKAQKIVRAMDEILYQFRWNYHTVHGPPDATNRLTGVTELHIEDPDDSPQIIKRQWDDNGRLPFPDDPLLHKPWSLPFQQANAPYFSDLSVDHKYRTIWGNSWSPADGANWTTSLNTVAASPFLQGLMARYKSEYETFLALHPMDFSWLGNSYYQGLVYARGSVNISHQFQILGTILCNQDVHIADGCKLIYDEEYFKQRGSLGPITVISMEEL